MAPGYTEPVQARVTERFVPTLDSQIAKGALTPLKNKEACRVFSAMSTHAFDRSFPLFLSQAAGCHKAVYAVTLIRESPLRTADRDASVAPPSAPAKPRAKTVGGTRDSVLSWDSPFEPNANRASRWRQVVKQGDRRSPKALRRPKLLGTLRLESALDGPHAPSYLSMG